MSAEIPSYTDGKEFFTGKHRDVLPTIVGWKLFGDISAAVDEINNSFRMFGKIKYELSEDQSQLDEILPLYMDGVVRVEVSNGLMRPNTPIMSSYMRRQLLNEIIDINFLRVSQELLHGEPEASNLAMFSSRVRESQIRAQEARMVMEGSYYADV